MAAAGTWPGGAGVAAGARPDAGPGGAGVAGGSGPWGARAGDTGISAMSSTSISSGTAASVSTWPLVTLNLECAVLHSKHMWSVQVEQNTTATAYLPASWQEVQGRRRGNSLAGASPPGADSSTSVETSRRAGAWAVALGGLLVRQMGRERTSSVTGILPVFWRKCIPSVCSHILPLIPS